MLAAVQEVRDVRDTGGGTGHGTTINIHENNIYQQQHEINSSTTSRRVNDRRSTNKQSKAPTSLFLFTQSSPLRRFMIWFVNWYPFEVTIICTIIANCVVMALDDKLANGDKTVLSRKMEDLEPIFMVIFTIEMCTKILAQGFILHKGSYMRTLWNIMDFIVVVSGFLPLILPAGSEESINLNTLRTFRVLRPLKLVSGVPSLQVVMSSIGKAIGPLVNIALLLLFAVIIFAIVGLEFYAGALHNTCYRVDNLDEIVMEGEVGSPCFPGSDKDAPFGSYTCDANVSICLEKWEGPNYGISSFDTIGLAMLTVFQCVTMEGWTATLYSMNDATGTAINFIFFIPLIVVGSFFMLNLVLGVLSGEFAKEKDRVESRAGFLLLKEEQKLEREMNGYMGWICKAEDLILAEERTCERDRKKIMEARRKAAEGKRKKKTEEEEIAGAKSEIGVKIRRARIKIRKMCKKQWWFWLVIILVFLNTCTVAIEHYNQPHWLSFSLHYAEAVFLTSFVFEMLTRLYALGFTVYFASAFNRFDCAVILGSVFEVVLVNLKPRAGSFGLSGLRALRLLRVFKVTKYWASLRNLVIALMNALSSILSLLFLLFLFIFIFALLGMQLFGGTFNFEEGTPTSNFDTCINALLTVFQVLTEEDWNQVMYTAIRSQGGREGGGLIFSLYFIMLTLCGNYCLLNVFLAIACDSLDQAAELTAAEEKEKDMENVIGADDAEKLLKEGGVDNRGGDPSATDGCGAKGGQQHSLLQSSAAPSFNEECGGEEEEAAILPYTSLFILSSTNPIRTSIHWLVSKPLFDIFIMFVILLSSAALAAEDPVQENSPRNKMLQVFDYGFTAIFGIECLLKILDLGLFFHPGSYLRDIWNGMDSLVVMCAIISIYFAGTPMGHKLKSVKLLRVLRPLKMVNRVPALKAVFDCVVISLKNVANILIVYMLFLLIFAMVGVQLFNGKFFYCSDAAKRTAEECQGEYFVEGEFGSVDAGIPSLAVREWILKSFHYDNCGAAMMTLFAVQTSEGWVAILQDSISSTFEDEGPIPWFSTDMAIFYIVYFVVFPFFFVNIFVALVIVTFNELGEAELTDDIDKNQKSCINYVIQAKPAQVYVPEEGSGLLFHIWRLVTSQPFENFILILIVMNTFLLMLKYDGAPLGYMDILSYCNLVFTILFTVECVLKLACFGYKEYFKVSWNTFDFITVVGSIIDATQIVNVGFLRLFRAARLVKLLRRSVSIRVLLFTFVQSIKALPYVMMLMIMLFFIYAIVGMQMFGNIILDSHTAIERHNNFRNVGQAFMLLFRCSTGEAWPHIMVSCVQGRTCDPRSFEVDEITGGITQPDKKCGSNMTYFYFISFIFLCSFIMLNIVVAVIMDSFDYLTRDSSILGSHHLSEFINVWCEFDPLGEGKLHHTDMYALLKQIDPPLGFGSKCPDLLAYKRLVRMNMPVDDEGRVHFTSTLFALVRLNLQIFVRSVEEMDQADQELRQTIGRIWPVTKRDGKLDLLVPPLGKSGSTTSSSGNNAASSSLSMIPTKTAIAGVDCTKGKSLLLQSGGIQSMNNLTVGKIYGGMLILENWRQTKFKSHVKPHTRLLGGSAQDILKRRNVSSSMMSNDDSHTNQGELTAAAAVNAMLGGAQNNPINNSNHHTTSRPRKGRLSVTFPFPNAINNNSNKYDVLDSSIANIGDHQHQFVDHSTGGHMRVTPWQHQMSFEPPPSPYDMSNDHGGGFHSTSAVLHHENYFHPSSSYNETLNFLDYRGLQHHGSHGDSQHAGGETLSYPQLQSSQRFPSNNNELYAANMNVSRNDAFTAQMPSVLNTHHESTVMNNNAYNNNLPQQELSSGHFYPPLTHHLNNSNNVTVRQVITDPASGTRIDFPQQLPNAPLFDSSRRPYNSFDGYSCNNNSLHRPSDNGMVDSSSMRKYWQSSQPNVMSSNVGNRRKLPKTPTYPPGTVILIENVMVKPTTDNNGMSGIQSGEEKGLLAQLDAKSENEKAEIRHLLARIRLRQGQRSLPSLPHSVVSRHQSSRRQQFRRQRRLPQIPVNAHASNNIIPPVTSVSSTTVVTSTTRGAVLPCVPPTKNRINTNTAIRRKLPSTPLASSAKHHRGVVNDTVTAFCNSIDGQIDDRCFTQHPSVNNNSSPWKSVDDVLMDRGEGNDDDDDILRIGSKADIFNLNFMRDIDDMDKAIGVDVFKKDLLQESHHSIHNPHIISTNQLNTVLYQDRRTLLK